MLPGLLALHRHVQPIDNQKPIESPTERGPDDAASITTRLTLCSHRRGNHIVRRQWPPDPLQLELTHRLDLHGVLDLPQHSRANEYLTGIGFAAKTRGDVGYRAYRGVVEPPLEPNGAKRSEAVRNADAE